MAANEKEAIKTAKTRAESFYYSSNKDMYHFIKLSAQNAKDEGFIKKSNELLKFMDDELITYNRAYGSRYDNAYGLAAYLPNYSSSSYSELKWAAESQWDELIKWYTAKDKTASFPEARDYTEVSISANKNPGAGANLCRWVWETVVAGVFWDGVKWVTEYVKEKEWVCSASNTGGGTFPPSHWNQKSK